LGVNRAEAQQRRLLGRHEQVLERLLETQDGAEQRLRGEGRTEGAGRQGPGTACWNEVARPASKPSSSRAPLSPCSFPPRDR
jgi:hypothetical protein